MTPRENLLASFSHRQPEWTPWVTLVLGVNTPSFAPAHVQSGADPVGLGLYLQENFGCDIIAPAPAVHAAHPLAAVSTARDGELTTTVTEIGNRRLVKATRTVPYGSRTSSYTERYPVQTGDDVETLRLLFADTVVALDTAELDGRTRRLGEAGLIHVNGPRTPIMQLIIEQMGAENLILALADAPRQMEELMAVMHTANLKQYRAIARTDCPVIGCYDDTSTSLVSPAMFRRYVLPPMRDHAEICHAAGKRFMMHSCGHVRGFLGMYREAGVDVHHYLSQPPVGDTTIPVAADEYGNAVTALVPVDPVLLEQGAPDEVGDHVHGMLRAAEGWRSFAVITASKPQMPEANLRAVADALGRGPGRRSQRPGPDARERCKP